MSITALTASGQQTRPIDKSPRMFLSVMIWEFRRFRASRLFWLQVLGLFAFLLFVMWTQQAPEGFSIEHGNVAANVFVAGTSVWGLLQALPIVLVLLVLFLPFITADGVTRDLKRRTHELLMTATLPTWAYVWGRYLTSLVMSLGLALLLLASILGMGLLLHLTVPAYPLPPAGAVLLLWVGMVLPATILVSSLSFALGTLLLRFSALVKIVILVGWIVGAMILPSMFNSTTPPVWYVNWDPTSAVTAHGLLSQYIFGGAITSATSEAQFQNAFLAMENKMPDLAGWFAPHLLLAGLSLLLVLMAALAFKRSRDMLN